MWWEVLGVEANASKKEIKVAYVRLIKDINQDTEIERFTNVKTAYDTGLKYVKSKAGTKQIFYPVSPKQEVLKTENEDGSSFDKLDKLIQTNMEHKEKDNPIYGEHLFLELRNLYNDVSNRFSIEKWKSNFEMMSFYDELLFEKLYVDFFNEHYLFTVELWSCFDEIYGLKSRKDFKWKELLSDNYKVTSAEVKYIENEKKEDYIQGNIDLLYATLNEESKKAFIILDSLYNKFDICDRLHRNRLIVSVEINNEEAVLESYNYLSKKHGEKKIAAYYYGGFLIKTKQYIEFDSFIKVLDKKAFSPELEELIGECSLLSRKRLFTIHKLLYFRQYYLPWIEASVVTIKDRRLINNGKIKAYENFYNRIEEIEYKNESEAQSQLYSEIWHQVIFGIVLLIMVILIIVSIIV